MSPALQSGLFIWKMCGLLFEISIKIAVRYTFHMRERCDVITIGTATMDVFLPLAEGVTKVVPGEKYESGSPIFATGGGAVNAAVTFARQGLNVGSIFRVGSDAQGDDIIADAEEEGVSCRAVRDVRAATGYSAIMLYPDGERTVVVHRGAADNLSAKDIAWGTRAPVWAYVAPGRIVPEAIFGCITKLYKAGVRVALNPSAWYLERYGVELKAVMSHVAVFIVNRGEAARFVGVPPEDGRGVFRQLDALMSGIAVMTDGPHGALVSDGATIFHTGIFPNERTLDRTGAGDAFGSGFVAGLMKTDDVREALRLASANATSNVERVGAHTGVLTLHEFEKGARWKKLRVTTELL